jgi:hypothetical protein
MNTKNIVHHLSLQGCSTLSDSVLRRVAARRDPTVRRHANRGEHPMSFSISFAARSVDAAKEKLKDSDGPAAVTALIEKGA